MRETGTDLWQGAREEQCVLFVLPPGMDTERGLGGAGLWGPGNNPQGYDKSTYV